jgi:transcriptional regulator with XRE-family HTH domain
MMMYLKKLLNEHNLTHAALSRKSGIPESTLRDILNGNTLLENCKAYTLMNLADALEISAEDLMDRYYKDYFGEPEDDDEDDWVDDDWYDNEIDNENEEDDEEEEHDMREETLMVHADSPIGYFYMLEEPISHGLKNCSTKDFVLETYEYHWVESFLHAHLIREALFMVGLLDYLCRKCGMKPNPAYETLRKVCLDEPVYSMDTMLKVNDSKAFARACLEAELDAIPELARHNIYLTEDDISLKA